MSEATTAKKLVYKKEPGVISWPCEIFEPQANGKHEKATLVVRFKVLPQERIEQAFPAMAVLQDPKLAREFLADAVVGFDGLTDEHGKSVDDEEVKKALLALPYIHDGVLRGFFDMIGRRLTKN